MDEGDYHGIHQVTFSEKTWSERIFEYLRFLPKEAPAFLAIVLSLWGVSEIIKEVIGPDVSTREYVAPVVLVAFVIVIYRAYVQYRDYVPEFLKDESAAVRRIYKRQKCGWQFALARQLIHDRISKDVESLARMQSGAEYVRPKKMSIEEYVVWLQGRPEALRRLMSAVAVQCTIELPAALAAPKLEADSAKIRLDCIRLSDLFRSARDLEIESHKIIPDGDLQELHKASFGWTEPVRSGVNTFLEILEELSTIDRQALKSGTVEPPSFSIPFESPKALDEFQQQFARIEWEHFGL